ncbi:MAG TPA: zinc-dependent alcohol dehydrogenase family protein [Steroidobacteraceae bacterium]|nr:zinc-dependent alcohol dehydrogenase family protein [Steroidobacteraceae bacterium]
MRLSAPGSRLRMEEIALPPAGEHQIGITVEACGVCRTDLHLVDGELPHIHYPITPGHEIVGRVTEVGPSVARFRMGDRVGVPWLAQACGQCRYCRAGQENLCEYARFTGYSVDGGYAEQVLADARFCLPLPDKIPAAQLAPLLCAGLIGYRAYRAAGSGTNLGLYGFGGAAHLLAQVARDQGRRVFAFTRPGDLESQAFARVLGAVWAGNSDEVPPEPLDAAILFAPVGALVPAALAAVRPGGRVVCAGIHMSDIPRFPYELLWGERSLSSVANLTRADGEEFLELAHRLALMPTVEPFPLRDANIALERLRSGALQGAAVLVAAPPGAP